LAYGNDGVVHAITTLANFDDGEDPTCETHSSDNGRTWSALTPAAPNPLYSFTRRNDAVIDNNSGSPFASRIYNSVTQNLPNLSVKVFVSRSADGGQTWKPALGLNLDRTHYLLTQGFSHLAIGKDGAVYLAAMATPDSGIPQKILFGKSTDGGVTWSAPVRVYDATGTSRIPNTDIFAANSPVIAVDHSNGPFAGRLYITFYNFTGSFMQVLVTHSTDGGATWSAPVPVASPSETHDQFQPFISVSPAGLPAVTWFDRRTDPQNVQYLTFVAFSRDGGVTWGRNTPISRTLSQPSFGGGHQRYMQSGPS
jgi:hypothetical protein